MENLPTELLKDIFGLLSIADACNLRLTSRNHAEVGAIEVFSTVRLVESIKSFENHRKISEHGVFRNYVKKLEYEASEPLPVEKLDWLRHIIPCQNQFRKKTDPDYLEDLIFIYEGYARCLREVEFIHDTGLDSATVTSAFIVYPNLKSVSVTANYFQYLPSRGPKGGLSSSVPFEFPGSLDNSYEDPFVELHPTGARSLKAVLSAAQVSGRELEELRVELVHINFFQLDPKYPTPMYSRAFFNLKHLYLNIGRHANFEMQDNFDDDTVEDRGPEALDTRVRYIGDLLGNIKGLESLGLSFSTESTFHIAHESIGDYGDNREGLYGTVAFDKLGQETTWPRLKRLELTGMDIYGAHFLAFIERHAPTLKELHMKHIWLLYGDWTTLLHNMRQKLALNGIGLKGFFGVQYDAGGRLSETEEEAQEIGMPSWALRYIKPWNMELSKEPTLAEIQEDKGTDGNVRKRKRLGDMFEAWFLGVPGAEFPTQAECRGPHILNEQPEAIDGHIEYYSGMLRPEDLGYISSRFGEGHEENNNDEDSESLLGQHVHFLRELSPYGEVLRRYPFARPHEE